jgi:hypothetical protein
MLALPHLSGTECIRVFVRFGYRPLDRAGGLASLRRGDEVVIIPESATLSPAVIASILRSAHLDPFDFLAALEDVDAPEPVPSRPAPKVA